MIFRVGIENKNESIRSIAWALDHPGCFAYGSNQRGAPGELPSAIHAYSEWIGKHEKPWLDANEIEPQLV